MATRTHQTGTQVGPPLPLDCQDPNPNEHVPTTLALRDGHTNALIPTLATLTQRHQAKVAELAALEPEEARLLGLAKVGYRTLIRWEIRRRQFGPIGCADDRWLRAGGGHPSLTEVVREAIHAVH